MQQKKLLKKIGIGLGAILFFLVLSYGFVPQVLEGQIVNQSDISGYIGMSHEMDSWNRAHPDDPTYWTGSMFSGMPTTAISTRNTGDWTQPLYDLLLTGRRPATYLFIALLGAFLLLLAFGISWPLALAGAVAIAFCSYNFQIIQVGHNTKMQAIAFMPWVLAAVVWTYRTALGERAAKGKGWIAETVLGATLFALALSLQIKANHQQITYYLAILVLLYALVLLIDVLVRQRKAFGRFVLASALMLVLGCVGVATNVNKLLPLYKYQEHTMRGGSELTGEKTGGLDLDYATAWSYGWQELPNLMIPNYNGGASSAAVNPDRSATVSLLRRAGQGNVRETAKHLPMYWGPQPFTAGPMYMGAITVFLFLLGLLLYRGRDKWWLLAATLLAVLMAVGSHFMAFTKLCFAVLPLYSKFRTVSMALVILQITLPLLGFLTLDRILKEDYAPREVRRKGLVAYLLTAGFCLLVWLIPSLAGDFSGPVDAGQPDILVDALAADRRMLFRQDAMISFVLITLTFLLLLWALSPKGQTEHAKAFAGAGRRAIAGGAIGVLVVVNLFAVGKRYLNADDFTTPKDFSRPFAERPVDKLIKADPDPSYRVLDLTVNVFNSSVPSYHHKSVGGYSPAKLQRYQDLIDRYLNREISAIYGGLGTAETVDEAQAALPETPVLNALNTRYIIVGPDNAPLYNPAALGPVWFVEDVAPADAPADELAQIGRCDLARTAVVGADFRDRTASLQRPETEIEDAITLTDYAPNALRYHCSASQERLAVFSEIYYPGWKAQLVPAAGTPEDIELIRADWTLRAALLPAGEYDLVMRFEPDSYRIGARVSRASSILLLFLALASIAGALIPRRKED